MELFQKRRAYLLFRSLYLAFGSYISGNTAFNAAFCIQGSREARHFWMRYLQLHRLPV